MAIDRHRAQYGAEFGVRPGSAKGRATRAMAFDLNYPRQPIRLGSGVFDHPMALITALLLGLTLLVGIRRARN